MRILFTIRLAPHTIVDDSTLTSGYELSGSSTRTCSVPGTSGSNVASWNGAAPTCIPKACGALAAPAQGSLTFSALPLHFPTATVNFLCNPGYGRSGPGDFTCIWADATSVAWSSDFGITQAVAPTCDPGVCNAFNTAPGFQVEYSPVGSVAIGAQAYFVCLAGYARLKIGGSDQPTSSTCVGVGSLGAGEFLLFTVIFRTNPAHTLTRSP